MELRLGRGCRRYEIQDAGRSPWHGSSLAGCSAQAGDLRHVRRYSSRAMASAASAVPSTGWAGNAARRAA